MCSFIPLLILCIDNHAFDNTPISHWLKTILGLVSFCFVFFCFWIPFGYIWCIPTTYYKFWHLWVSSLIPFTNVGYWYYHIFIYLMTSLSTTTRSTLFKGRGRDQENSDDSQLLVKKSSQQTTRVLPHNHLIP